MKLRPQQPRRRWPRAHLAPVTPHDGQRHIRARVAARWLLPLLLPLPLLLLPCTATYAEALDLRLAPTLPTTQPRDLWLFLPVGYLLSVAVETPVLVVGLARQLSLRQRLFAGFWLTACTYPIVVLVLPVLCAATTRNRYLLIAETFAPAAECVLFWLAYRHSLAPTATSWPRKFAVIVLANLLSFGVGELFNATHWFGLF